MLDIRLCYRHCLPILLVVWLLGACGSKFEPDCVEPTAGTLAYPGWAATSPVDGAMWVLSGDLREEYCYPFLTRYTLAGQEWQADTVVEVPPVAAGKPALPVGAAFGAQGDLWVADRRGQRLLHWGPSIGGTPTEIDVGVELAQLVVDVDTNMIFASDATATQVAAIRMDDGAVTRIATESGLRVIAMALAGSDLVVAYETGTYLSRLNRSNLSWQRRVIPFDGDMAVIPGEIVVDPATQDLILPLPTLRRVYRFSAASGYELFAASVPLGRPRFVSQVDGMLYVHDDEFGVWLLDGNMNLAGVQDASPQEALSDFIVAPGVPSAGIVLDATELQTW